MKYPYYLPPLGYSYDAMEPYIDRLTMELHHDRHLRTYVDKLNATLKDYPQYHGWSLEELIRGCYRLPLSIRQAVWDNGGGLYNHTFFFGSLSNTGQGIAGGKLYDAIVEQFGSVDSLMDKLSKAALGVFGSGYAYLVRDNGLGILKIITLANQDTPIVYNVTPLVCIDVWEHAYYLKHYNDRAGYIGDWKHIINWSSAEYAYGARSGCGV